MRAIIVDDDKQCRETLDLLLKTCCPQVDVVAHCQNIDEARHAIEKELPELVFLDVEMPNGTGFDLLDQLEPVNFEVIFTTAHDEYAIRAFKFSALDFLLKPIGRDDIEQAINRAEDKISKNQMRIDTLLYNLNYLNTDKKLALPTINGYEFVSVSEIMRCESDGNYTVFYMLDRAKIVVSRTLKEYEDLLEEFQFFRVHHGHLINLRHIKNYVKGEGGTIMMADNSSVPVSRRKRDEFLKKLSII